jgi:hypothetical protein
MRVRVHGEVSDARSIDFTYIVVRNCSKYHDVEFVVELVNPKSRYELHGEAAGIRLHRRDADFISIRERLPIAISAKVQAAAGHY